MRFRDIIELEWLIRKYDDFTYRIQKEEGGKWVTIYKEEFTRKRRFRDVIRRLFKRER